MKTTKLPAPATSPEATGSASVPGTSYPRNVIRVVLQVEDTPSNQIVLKRVYEMITEMAIPDPQHAILKAEQIEIVRVSMPNEKLTDSRRE